MAAKIPVKKPLVILHGDEMAQIAFERILDQFVREYLDVTLVEIDLSAEQRLLSNGAVVRDAIATVGAPLRRLSPMQNSLEDIFLAEVHGA